MPDQLEEVAKIPPIGGRSLASKTRTTRTIMLVLEYRTDDNKASPPCAENHIKSVECSQAVSKYVWENIN